MLPLDLQKSVPNAEAALSHWTSNIWHLRKIPVTISQLRKRLGCQQKQWPQVVAMVQITVLRCSRLLATCCEEVLPEEAHQLSSYPFCTNQCWSTNLTNHTNPRNTMTSHAIPVKETILREWHYGQLLCDSFDLHLQREGMVWSGAVGRALRVTLWRADMQNSGKRRIHCADRIEPSNC